MDRVPRFLVLGGPVPPGLAEELAGTAELFAEGEIDMAQADGVLLHDVGDVFPALRRFRAAGAQMPVFGITEGPADIRARLQWIREGADDLLHRATAVEVLRRRLEGITRATDPRHVGPRLDRWLRALHRYVAVREDLVRALGDAGRARFVDTAFLRDQVMRAADEAPTDPFGQRRGGDREELRWGMKVLDPEGEAELINIGPDGVCFAAKAGPEAALRVLVEGDVAAAEIDLEVRWKRRVARDRWEAGAIATAVRMRRG